jgi:hypothetical protein
MHCPVDEPLPHRQGLSEALTLLCGWILPIYSQAGLPVGGPTGRVAGLVVHPPQSWPGSQRSSVLRGRASAAPSRDEIPPTAPREPARTCRRGGLSCRCGHRSNWSLTMRPTASRSWGGRSIRAKTFFSVLHAMSWVALAALTPLRAGARSKAAACIARKVIPRVRPPVCCVQYSPPKPDAACNVYCTP